MFDDNNLKQFTNMDNKEAQDALFEHATEGILVTNSSGIIIKVNPAVVRMFRYTPEELLGQKVEILIPARFSEKHTGYRDKYYTSPHPRSMGSGLDLFGRRKDGTEFPLEISLSPYASDGEKKAIAFIIDISLRKLAEEKLKNYSNELEIKVEERTMILREAIDELEKTKDELNDALVKEKELNDLKSRFVSLVSHEFRTPLAGVMSSLSLVRQYGEKNDFEKQQKHIERIKESVNGLTDILNDLLSLSRLEEGKVAVNYEQISLEEFVSDIAKDLDTAITKRDQKIIYTHTGEADVILDKKIIKHILFNLISNAIKFSPEGKKINVATIADKNRIVFTVKDEGMGISKEDQQHLFERFFRGHNVSNIQGTGLGLNIVAKYVEMLKGKINFESELEKGTTFIITIPNKQTS